MGLSVPGVLCVIGGTLYHLALGYFYTVGNMNPYIISYMNIKSGETTWFSSTILAVQSVFVPVGAILATVINYRIVLIIGIIFSAGGILLTRLTVDYGLGPYISTYCIVFGIGMGIPYSVIFQIASEWFPRYRTTVVGIIASGFGLGALIFTPIQTAIINPKNLGQVNGVFPDEVLRNVPTAFLVLGGIVLCLEIIGTIIIRKCPDVEGSIGESTIGFSEEEDKESVIKTRPESVKMKVPRSLSLKEAIKTTDFYLLFIAFFLNIMPVVMLTTTSKIFGIKSGFDDKFASDIATSTAVFNCVGRVWWGFMVDRFSWKLPMLTYIAIWAAFFVTIPYVVMPYVSNDMVARALYAIWVFVLFFCLSANFVVVAGAVTRIYGPGNMATIYGLIYVATCPSALITAGAVSQFDINDQWIPIYSACACACVISLIAVLFVRDLKPRIVGFTNNICAIVCDPCRQSILEKDEIYDEAYNEETTSSSE